MQTSESSGFALDGREVFIGGGEFRCPDDPDSVCHAVSVVDLASKRHRLVDVTFLPHGIALDPRQPQRIAVCEKIGPGAAMIDLNTWSVIEPITTSAERLFYGHCAFSHDGSVLYTTETYKDSSEGTIVVRNSDTLEITGEFPSFGSNPHECLLVDGGKTMVVTNGGGDQYGGTPNVAYIDVARQTLIKQEMLTNRHLNTGHLAVGQDESLVVVSAPRLGEKDAPLGGVSIQPQGKKMRSITSPKKIVSDMIGEALSVMVHQERATVTHPGGGMVTFWEIPNRRFIKDLRMPKPRGVAMTEDQRQYVISYGEDASLILVDAESLEPIETSRYRASYVTGSHLYNWSAMAHVLNDPSVH